jgi:ApaG protein
MTKNTALTSGILIKVSTQYRADISLPEIPSFFFDYRIDIENRNSFAIQLMHRDWFVFDSLNTASHISGEGVIGKQPVLQPGETFTYTSGCELKSEIGSMSGFYTCKNLESDELFKVDIPTFDLTTPFKLN